VATPAWRLGGPKMTRLKRQGLFKRCWYCCCPHRICCCCRWCRWRWWWRRLFHN